MSSNGSGANTQGGPGAPGTTNTGGAPGTQAPTGAADVALQEKCDNIVEQYRKGTVKRAEAFGKIYELLSAGGDRPGVLHALKSYGDALDNHDQLTADARKRGSKGRPQEQSDESSSDGEGEDPQPRGRHPPPKDLDVDEADKGPDAADEDEESGAEALFGGTPKPAKKSSKSRGGKRKRGELDLEVSADGEPIYPWQVEQILSPVVLSPELRKTRNALDHWAEDLKAAYLAVVAAPHRPEFPADQWKKLLAGEAVDLDKVYTNVNALLPDNRVKHTLADGIVIEVVGETTASKRVHDQASWSVAWSRLEAAMLFLFPHRVRELRIYHEHIVGLFLSMFAGTHEFVIAYDQAVRKRVAQRGNIMLSDIQLFADLHLSNTSAFGAQAYAKASAATSSVGLATHAHGDSSRGSSSKSGRKSSEPCRRFNANRCPHQSQPQSCNYRHICSTCKRVGHSAADKLCSAKGGSEGGSR